MTDIRPIAETEDTVTLRRKDFEALVEAVEDALDVARIREVEARVAAGETEYLPIEMVDRMLAGESRVRVWREHRGLSARALADRASISATYLSEIETGRKRGSLDAIVRLARALGVDIEDLVAPEVREPARG